MNILVSPNAQVALDSIEDFVESKNTPGSGQRYLANFFSELREYAQPNVSYKKCRDERLALLKYSCLNFKNWIIAFKIEDGNFNIYEIIWGPILK